MRALNRDLSLPGAVMLGLGSMVGTGIFVSVGLAAGIAGGWVLVAIALAALLALANALSSAQLAAAFPVSGGTYEYGRRLLSPTLGFTAGWVFLLAKTASAATAALGCAGYLGRLGVGVDSLPVTAVGVIVVVTMVVTAGLRRSSAINVVIVTVTLLALVSFVIVGAPAAWRALESSPGMRDAMASEIGVQGARTAGEVLPSLFEATALMFVAFTGYGRLATLGEEVVDPKRTIPRAIVISMVITASIYLAVAAVAVVLVGGDALGVAAKQSAAPLELVAGVLEAPWLRTVIAVGAVTAMLGVLLNLLLGLSRVVLAMARQGDAPRVLARLSRRGDSPTLAVLACAAVITALAMVGSVKLAWSFSAFTVLVYYALTNGAALRLPRELRRSPVVIAWCGLLACLALAFWVEWRVWVVGLGVIAAGLALRAIARCVRTPRDSHRAE